MTELLRIAIPNGEVIERHLPHREITLGRDRANAIVIDHPSVARWHVRFVPEFAGWAVVDLESAGGTYLDGQRLEPGVASPLGRGVALRIGDVQGILTEVKGDDAGDEEIVAAAETFAIAVQPLSEPITPGEHGALTLEIHNIGTAADEFMISVPSLPAEWVEIHPPTLSLGPGARDEATILVKPPRRPDALHGHHDVTVSVVSRLRPREERELTTVSIEPYMETHAAISPPEGTGDYVLSLHNNGNTPIEFDLLAATEAVGVTVEMAEHSVHLQPGQGREVEVRVHGVQRPLWRPMGPHPITVSAKARSHEQEHEVSVLRHRPPRHPWLPYALLTAAAVVVVLSAWAFEWWWFDQRGAGAPLRRRRNPADSLRMQRLSDDEWIAQMRARVASGEAWDAVDSASEPVAAVATAPERPARTADDLAAKPFPCPSCDQHWPLEVYRRYEMVSAEPLRYCTRCYGFWAASDAVARGVRDPGDDHHAFVSAVAPPRCRACDGWRFTPDGKCRKCEKPMAPFCCPACNTPMARFQEKGVTLDGCAACKGTWFETGEIARVYGLAPAQSMAMSQVDENAADNVPPPGFLALNVLLRIFLPWLPY